jgi:hypothetical protein
MLKVSLLAALLGFSAASLADGPGTRIRAETAAPQPRTPASERDLDRCATMRTEEKERCMKAVRAAAAAEEKRRGPEATGAASGGTSTTAPR